MNEGEYMSTIHDVEPQTLIEGVSKELKTIETVAPPAWSLACKTGVNRERPPANRDWWHIRAASILRRISLKGPLGVSKLRTVYGGKKRRGHQPPIFKVGSGNIIRKILQQLEKAELIKQDTVGNHKGRVITPTGMKLLNKVIKETAPKEAPKVAPKAEPKKEEKPKDAPKQESPKETPKAVAKPSLKEAPKVEPKKEEKPKEAPQAKKEDSQEKKNG